MKHLNLIFIILLLSFTSYAQDPVTFELREMADVLDNADSEEFYKIPELKSKNGKLEVHLYAHEDEFEFAGDMVKLRNYSYETDGITSKIPAPFGPTLRISPSDRLTIILHNDLPTGPDKSYLGSIDNGANNKRLFNNAGTINSTLVDILTTGTSNRITADNLKGAKVKVITRGKEWTVLGREACTCPPGQEGTCEYKDIEYTVKEMFNPGINKKALRIYETLEHSEENHNIPHGFNKTNMHTHGFHVSPFQDDILRVVPPDFFSYYTYDLVDHTPGTMWYHPHVHGSTAIQVASGMSGVIIIEDGDLSQYPALEKASKPEHERVLLFNQIVYDEEIHELPDFNTLIRSKPPKGTTINGQVKPEMAIRPGEVQRWRMVHSGYSSLLAMSFPKEVEVYQIAIDGIMFDEPRRIYSLHMAPGNRSDILIRVPKETNPKTIDIKSVRYNLDCEYFPNKNPCKKEAGPRDETLMKLVVSGNKMNMRFPRSLPGPGAGHADIPDSELDNLGSPRKTNFKTVGKGEQFLINGKEFEADTIHEILTLGDVEEWELSSSNKSHPYHIHINPFQVTKLVDDQGRSYKVDPPIWKDVALISPKRTTFMRTRYQKYWGDFVLHCHILAHEDMGMMQRIRIQRKKPKAIKKNPELKKR